MGLATLTLRCSKLARYMVCAGYLHLEFEEPAEAGFPAKEGTAFGEYQQALLEGRPAPAVASNGIYIDQDMKFYGPSLVENIFSRATSPVVCETRIDWQTHSGIIIRGQPDATYEMYDDLCVDDFKYGWGIVEVKENWQLIGYAIGEIIRRNRGYRNIRMRIMQPRPHHEDGAIREWVISYPQLLEYKEKIEKRMMELVNGRKDFQTSDKCKYCEGCAEACPAFSRLFYRALEVSMEFVQDSLTNDELSRQLDQVKRAQEVLKIKSDSLVELGTSRIKRGELIPNYVQVQQTGHRAWRQGVSPESVKVMTGKDAMKNEFMSPAQLEKLGVPKSLIAQLTTVPVTGVKLERKDGSEIGNKIFGTNNPLGG